MRVCGAALTGDARKRREPTRMPDPASNQEKAWQKAHRLGEGVQGALTDPRPRGKLDPQDQDVEGNG